MPGSEAVEVSSQQVDEGQSRYTGFLVTSMRDLSLLSLMSNMSLTELSLCVKYSVKCQGSHEDLVPALKEFEGSLLHLYTLLFIVHLKDKV